MTLSLYEGKFNGFFRSRCKRLYQYFPAAAALALIKFSHSASLHCRYFNETVHHDLFHNKIVFIKTLTPIPSMCHQNFPVQNILVHYESALFSFTLLGKVIAKK